MDRIEYTKLLLNYSQSMNYALNKVKQNQRTIESVIPFILPKMRVEKLTKKQFIYYIYLIKYMSGCLHIDDKIHWPKQNPEDIGKLIKILQIIIYFNITTY